MPDAPVRALDRWELYRVLGEPVRLRLLALAAAEELGVGELAELVGESQPSVSRHVAALRDAGLVRVRREGQRAYVSAAPSSQKDAVVRDALETGRRLVESDGSLARVSRIVGARDEAARAYFATARDRERAAALPAELRVYMRALAPLLPHRALAVDVGTGDGPWLELLAPLYERVLAVDRSEAQLAAARRRAERLGASHVRFLRAGWDDPVVIRRVGQPGADLVVAARVLHHAPSPPSAIACWARLLAPHGVLLVLDYAPHGDERMRERHADLWLGFARDDLTRWSRRAGLDATVLSLPPIGGSDAPDRHLSWHALVARRDRNPARTSS
ncbi:MAG: metalloregulator ArsR/SmtB family transcription factor [Myxococcales bacterium]|nr:metalloregulator ArsR/SmtB family transcription factor [Myxococcales bacterium]